MDLFAGLKSEIFRPLVTLLIPGALAISPWWGVLFSWFPSIWNLFGRQQTIAWVVGSGTALAVGMVLENFGSRIEWLWDLLRDRQTNDQHGKRWTLYLQLSNPEKIVGHRYIRTVLVRMKFELSMAPAAFIAAVGLLVWHKRTSVLGPNYFWFVGAALMLGAYFLWESYSSVKVMDSIRDDVLKVHRL